MRKYIIGFVRVMASITYIATFALLLRKDIGYKTCAKVVFPACIVLIWPWKRH